VSRLARRVARPLAERDRQRALGALALALLLAAAVLSVLAPAGHRSTPAASSSQVGLSSTSVVPLRVPLADTPRAVLRAGRRFLAGYLSLLYGRSRPRGLSAASTALRARLRRGRFRTPPAMRRRRPRVVSLIGHRLATGSRWVLTARIADGSVRYSLELMIATVRGRAVVVGLGED
jgi:hypothetical protein